jgi:hypothetical protein
VLEHDAEKRDPAVTRRRLRERRAECAAAEAHRNVPRSVRREGERERELTRASLRCSATVAHRPASRVPGGCSLSSPACSTGGIWRVRCREEEASGRSTKESTGGALCTRSGLAPDLSAAPSRRVVLCCSPLSAGTASSPRARRLLAFRASLSVSLAVSASLLGAEPADILPTPPSPLRTSQPATRRRRDSATDQGRCRRLTVGRWAHHERAHIITTATSRHDAPGP